MVLIFNLLTELGLKHDRQKVNLYYERGKIPQPELWMDGAKYWFKDNQGL